MEAAEPMVVNPPTTEAGSVTQNGSSSSASTNAMDDGNSGKPPSDAPSAPDTRPSLRGKLFREEDSVICRGMWANCEADHAQPEFTSQFEQRLVTAADPAAFSRGDLAISGHYTGWFHLKVVSRSPLKVEEKIELNFTPVGSSSSGNGRSGDASGLKVAGGGTNKFGKFTIEGTAHIESDGLAMKLYRTYVFVPKAQKDSRRSSSGGQKRTRDRSDYTRSSGTTSARGRPPASSNNRAAATTATAIGGGVDCRPAQPPAPPTRRERRASKFVLKCRDLLRALIKEPFASIFYDPVDPIKLGIPDYPKIVTNPMSLSEVSIRLEGNEYSIPENFQEDVKLTFSNAIKYNTQDGETNEVRVAAFTLLTRFNSMYSAMLQELQGDSQPDAPPTPGLAAEQTGSGGGGGGGSARGAKGARGPPPKSAAVLADEKRREEAAALQTEISQAQQKMNSMRSRLVDLQKAVLKDDAKDAARAVLPTQKELRALVTAVQGLPRRKLEVVLQIVQTALPRSHPLMARGAGAEGQSISLPIEDLDVFTVRTLMDAVRGASG